MSPAARAMYKSSRPRDPDAAKDAAKDELGRSSGVHEGVDDDQEQQGKSANTEGLSLLTPTTKKEARRRVSMGGVIFR